MRRRSLAAILLGAALAPITSSGPTHAAPGTAPIIGGSAVPEGMWRDTVAVLYGGEQGCTGVLVAPTVVLTAGHCTDPEEGDLPDGALIGTNSLARPSAGETIDVTRVVMHPGGVYDLGLLVLAEASTIDPRPLASGWVQGDVVDGAAVELVGYGSIDRDGKVYVDELQRAASTVTDAGCNHHRGCAPAARPNGEVGAGGGGIDTCPGDSGGPMYLTTDYGAFVVGITARGYLDNRFLCSEGGIYVRPDKDELLTWIEQESGVLLPVGRGPRAGGFEVDGGGSASVSVDPDDPRPGRSHGFEIATPPAHGTAEIAADGTLTVTAAADYQGPDSVVVRATDTIDPTRSARGRISYEVVEGGGCCQTGGGRGQVAPALLGSLGLGLLLRRRRRSSAS